MDKKNLEQMIRLTVIRYCTGTMNSDCRNENEQTPCGISKDELLQRVLERSSDSSEIESATRKYATRKNYIFPILRQCATVLIAISVIAAVVLLISPEARILAGLSYEKQSRTEIFVVNAIVQVDNEFGFESYPSDYKWTCGYIPEGYELVEEQVLLGIVGWHRYVNAEQEDIEFSYWSKESSTAYTLDISDVSDLESNGYWLQETQGNIFVSQDTNCYYLYWERDGYFFTLSGNDLIECNKIRKSIY